MQSHRPTQPFGRLYSPTTGKARLGMRPSKKSIRRMVEKLHAMTATSTTWQETTQMVGKLNRTLRGWANYFQVGTVSSAYRAIDSYLAARLRPRMRTKFKKRRQRGGGYPPRSFTATRARTADCGGVSSWAKA